MRGMRESTLLSEFCTVLVLLGPKILSSIWNSEVSTFQGSSLYIQYKFSRTKICVDRPYANLTKTNFIEVLISYAYLWRLHIHAVSVSHSHPELTAMLV